MKLSKKEKKESEPVKTEYSGPDFPWGLSISLNDDSLDKLGIKAKDLKVGAEVVISAKAKVTSISENQYENGKTHQHADLQITKMEIGDANNAENAFNEGD